MTKDSYISTEVLSEMITYCIGKNRDAEVKMSYFSTPDRLGGNNLKIEFYFLDEKAKVDMNYGRSDSRDFETDLQNSTKKGKGLLADILGEEFEVKSIGDDKLLVCESIPYALTRKSLEEAIEEDRTGQLSIFQ